MEWVKEAGITKVVLANLSLLIDSVVSLLLIRSTRMTGIELMVIIH